MKSQSVVMIILSLTIFMASTLATAEGAEKSLKCWRCKEVFTVPASTSGEINCPKCGARCVIKAPTPRPTPSPAPPPTPVPGSEPESISWRVGSSFIGQQKSVKGKIVGSHISSRSGNLYLNFDRDYYTYLSIKIPNKAVGKFPSGAASYYNGKMVVATGKIIKDGKFIRLIITVPDNLIVLD